MKYIFYCERCNYKRITDGTDVGDMKLIKSSPVQTKIPYLDPLTKKTVVPAAREQPKKTKCPKCGRLITVKKYNVPEPPPAVAPIEEDRIDGSQTSNEGLPISRESGGTI